MEGVYQGSGSWFMQSFQGLKQGPGVLEVSSVKALGESAIHRRQEIPRLGTFALALPQAAETHGSTEFQRFCLPVACQVAGVTETRFCLTHLRMPGARLEQQLTPEPVQLRGVETLPDRLLCSQSLDQHTQSCLWLLDASRWASMSSALRSSR
jgi:hypothetical protein